MKELEQCKVMVVDDTETNIDLLLDTLGDIYDVRVAMDGQTALNDIMEDKPDLVLLDVMMPEMDGYEVCRRLKEKEDTRDIPIIFLTALKKGMDEAKGLALGAVDYVTKPFNPELVKARVHNQLILKLQRDELAKQNEILLENARLKEDIERITKHDLKSPLNGIINFPALILRDQTLSETNVVMLKKTMALGRKMLNMINLSLDLYKMENKTYQYDPQDINIIPIIHEIIEENAIKINSYKLTIRIVIDGEEAGENSSFLLPGEQLLFYSMLANIIKNALEAAVKGETITIDLKHSNTDTIRIHNQKAVPEEIKDTFFDKYVTFGKSTGTGLGTYSAKLIAETLGAEIRLDSSEQEGTTITFAFPLKLQQKHV